MIESDMNNPVPFAAAYVARMEAQMARWAYRCKGRLRGREPSATVRLEIVRFPCHEEEGKRRGKQLVDRCALWERIYPGHPHYYHSTWNELRAYWAGKEEYWTQHRLRSDEDALRQYETMERLAMHYVFEVAR